MLHALARDDQNHRGGRLCGRNHEIWFQACIFRLTVISPLAELLFNYEGN